MGIKSFLGSWGRRRGEGFARTLLQGDEKLLVVLTINNFPTGALAAIWGMAAGDAKVGFLCLTNKRMLLLEEDPLGTKMVGSGNLPLSKIVNIQYDGKNTVSIKDKNGNEYDFKTEVVDRSELAGKMVTEFKKLS